MIAYRYKGLTSGGVEVQGVVEAFDRADAVTKAKANCRVLIEIAPVKSSDGILNADIGQLLGGGKIKPKKLALLCSQLAIEQKAGLPLVRSLELVAENEQDKTLKRILTEVAEDVHAGNGLADSFAKRGPQLPKSFIETVRAGEDAGRLDDSFTKLKVYYENSASVASKVTSAMVYPIMLIVVAIVVVAIIMIKAVPVFESSFADLGSELPGITKMLIAISNFFVNYWLLGLAILAAVILAAYLYGKTDSGSHLYARIALKFPGIGMVNIMNGACELCSTLSTMLSAGLPLVQAATITANVASNLLISEDIRSATTGVIEGNTLGSGLKDSPWIPNLLKEMIAVGEETGKLEDTLNVVNDYYTQEVGTAVQRALGILEPCIVLVLAGLVVFILLSVYLPLFSMYGSI